MDWMKYRGPRDLGSRLARAGRRVDRELDDRTRWSWLDLWSGVVLGLILGSVGAAAVIRDLLVRCNG